MEITEVIVKLHEHYNLDHEHGCLNRAVILYLFMKDKGLNPRIEHFQIGGKNEFHYVVLLGNKVYDANIDPSENPMEKGEHPQFELKWIKWEISSDRNYSESILEMDLPKFDKKFQGKIRDLMEKHKDDFRKTYN